MLDNELAACKAVCPTLTTWVETGTYKGESSRRASAHFPQIYTFEVNPQLHADAVSAAASEGLDTSGYWLGDSPELLTRYLTTTLPTQPKSTHVLFFLDAHLSGSDTGHNGLECVPLLRELQVIDQHYPSDRPALLCIDDVRLFGAVWDWQQVTLPAIGGSLSHHRIVGAEAINDRLYVLLNQGGAGAAVSGES